MNHLILINFEKKMSFLSLVFMILSIMLVYGICIYNASFELSEFYLLEQWDIIVDNYLIESLHLIEFIGVIFIVLLVELELFYNTDNFDSYFVVLKGKNIFYLSKFLSYLIIIFLYTLILFLGFILIYIIRFKTIFHCEFMLNCFVIYLLYFVTLFMISFLVMILFKNYYSIILVFLYYWITKIVDNKNVVLKTLLPKIDIDVSKMNVNIGSNIGYLLLFMGILFIINMHIYGKKDMKIHS